MSQDEVARKKAMLANQFNFGEENWKTSEECENEEDAGAFQEGHQTIKLRSGDVYTGYVVVKPESKEAVMHTEGKDPATLTFTTGSVYKGGFRNNKKHGHGVFRYADGSIYDGNWTEDEKHDDSGNAKYTFANGFDTYTGQIEHGKFHGQGLLISGGPQGSRKYVGQFLNNKKHGEGIQYQKNGDVVSGKCFFENKISGEDAKIVYAEGSNKREYRGAIVEGRREGFGKMLFGDGKRYEGEWHNDLYHGRGTVFFPDTGEGEARKAGRVLDTDWLAGKQVGPDYTKQKLQQEKEQAAAASGTATTATAPAAATKKEEPQQQAAAASTPTTSSPVQQAAPEEKKPEEEPKQETVVNNSPPPLPAQEQQQQPEQQQPQQQQQQASSSAPSSSFVEELKKNHAAELAKVQKKVEERDSQSAEWAKAHEQLSQKVKDQTSLLEKIQSEMEEMKKQNEQLVFKLQQEQNENENLRQELQKQRQETEQERQRNESSVTAASSASASAVGGLASPSPAPASSALQQHEQEQNQQQQQEQQQQNSNHHLPDEANVIQSRITFPFQGYLFKFSLGKHFFSASNWKKRYMILEVSPLKRLRYLEKQDGAQKGSIPLEGAKLIDQCTVEVHDRSRHPERELAIVFMDKETNPAEPVERTLLIRAGSVTEKAVWLLALKLAVEHQEEK